VAGLPLSPRMSTSQDGLDATAASEWTKGADMTQLLLVVAMTLSQSSGTVTKVSAMCGPTVVTTTYRLQTEGAVFWGTATLRRKAGGAKTYHVSFQRKGTQEIGKMVVADPSTPNWLYVEGVVNFTKRGVYVDNLGLSVDVCPLLGAQG